MNIKFIALLFLDHDIRRGEGSASRPRRSLPPGMTRYPLYRTLGGPQGLSGQVRKISPPTGIRSPDCPARSQSLYRLRYPAHTIWYEALIISIVLNYPLPIFIAPNRGEGMHWNACCYFVCSMNHYHHYLEWTYQTSIQYKGGELFWGDCFAWLYPSHTLRNHSSCFITSYNCGHFVCIESAQRFVFVCVISRSPTCSMG